jgi:hypothetical protein
VSSLEPVPAAVVYDINVLVTAAASGNSPFRSWPSPPPVSGNASADCLGVIVDAAEFALWLSPHIITNIDRMAGSLERSAPALTVGARESGPGIPAVSEVVPAVRTFWEKAVTTKAGPGDRRPER